MVEDKNTTMQGTEVAAFLNQLNELVEKYPKQIGLDPLNLIQAKLNKIQQITDLAQLLPLLPSITKTSQPSSSFWQYLGFTAKNPLETVDWLIKKRALHLAIVQSDLSPEEDEAMTNLLRVNAKGDYIHVRLLEKYLQLKSRGVIHVSSSRKIS